MPPDLSLKCYKTSFLFDQIQRRAKADKSWEELLTADKLKDVPAPSPVVEQMSKSCHVCTEFCHICTEFGDVCTESCHVFITFVAAKDKKTQGKANKTGPFGKVGVFGKKPDKPKKSFVGQYDALATSCGLVDRFELEYTREYLWLNGEYTLKLVSHVYTELYHVCTEACHIYLPVLQVTADGNCMFRAIWSQFGFPGDTEREGPEEAEEGKVYDHRKLRLQKVAAIIKMCEVRGGVMCPVMFPHSCVMFTCYVITFTFQFIMFLQDIGYQQEIKEEVAGLYGFEGDEEEGPFSLKTYLE